MATSAKLYLKSREKVISSILISRTDTIQSSILSKPSWKDLSKGVPSWAVWAVAATATRISCTIHLKTSRKQSMHRSHTGLSWVTPQTHIKVSREITTRIGFQSFWTWRGHPTKTLQPGPSVPSLRFTMVTGVAIAPISWRITFIKSLLDSHASRETRGRHSPMDVELLKKSSWSLLSKIQKSTNQDHAPLLLCS